MLSIVTPVLNAKRYIRGCLNKVIARGCLVIEHIWMYGWSTDRTVVIAREIASAYGHIRAIPERDRRQSHAPEVPLLTRHYETLHQ